MALTDSEIVKIRNVMAQQEITAIIYRLARGLDRRDKALLASCFHEGATDDHGLFVGSAPDFCEWVTTTEAYFIAHHVMPTADGPKKDVIAAGRYLDRFEFKNDEWRITHRKALYDWSRVEETKDGWANPPISEILERGQQGLDDLSYEFLKGLV